ncbi:MAG TPA: CBS domain-containing protein [Candidatus Sulfomarinibacteraceae bacterium]|nr:CBS domain-containing protein [Candidatus Sulfomarinibacteraceae bacterium]
MTGRLRLARDTTVEACQALLGIEPLLVARDADLLDVVRSAGRQPATRVIGVVDPAGRIVGVIPVTRVAESIVARVVPESLLVDVEDEASAVRFSHSVEDRIASDVMLPPATTVPSATIGAAFREMHRRRLGGLYIVDEAGRPTGYLDLLELAIVYVRALAEAAADVAGPQGAGGSAAEPGA